MKKIFGSIIVLFVLSVAIIFLPSDKLFSQTHKHAPGTTCSAESHAAEKKPDADSSADSHAGHDHSATKTTKADPHAGHDHGAAEMTKTDPHAGHNHSAAETTKADPHAGHDHSAHANVGLTPIKELYEPECEHNIKTIDCDECRYELGAVKITDQLEKMLKTQILSQAAKKQEVVFRGELEFDTQLFRTITSVVPGVISSMPVRKGEIVEQGQVIAVIESRELSHTALELQKLLAELALAQKKLAREEMLNEKKVGAMQSVQEAQAARDLIALEIKCNKEQLSLFGLNSKEIEAVAAGRGSSAQRGRLQITSPIQGRIVTVHSNIGSAVNEQQAIVDVVDIRQLRAVGQIKEADIPTIIKELKKGNMHGFITTQAFQGSHFPAMAVSADAGLKSATRMLEIQLEVKNPDELLRPGMFIEGTLEVGESDNKTILPASAVLEDEGKHFIFVKHENSMYFRRDVTIEGQQGDQVFIGADFNPGAEIVTEGAFLLKSDILRAKMGAGCSH